MATFTNQTKNTSTFVNPSKNISGLSAIAEGTPMGLLLALTYTNVISTPSWANASKNSSSFTHLVKN